MHACLSAAAIAPLPPAAIAPLTGAPIPFHAGDDETRKKREAKFGKATESSASLVDPAKLKERQERFGVASLNDEARKKVGREEAGDYMGLGPLL